MIKKETGVTLISLSIAVIIILVITGMIVYSAKDSVYIEKLTNMQNDVANLRDKVSLYYSKYADIPAKTEYPDVSNLENAGVIGANDTGKFLILELESLEGLTLNYGKDYETYKANNYENLTDLTDIYIINETSHNIFYVEGIRVNQNGETKMYYTDYTQGDKEAVEIIEVKEIPIPEGFYHVGDTTLKEGYVISDEKEDDLDNTKGGNQYVWIPVDGILGEDGTIDDVRGTNGKKKILLGRYEFNELGVPSEYSENDYKEETQQEHTTSGYGNTIAKDIEGFIESVRKNGGYYIARFEASKNVETNKVESKYGKNVYNNTTQLNAASVCQNLYAGIHSDLMNSYAWDTAILFIQKYSTDDDYSRQKRLQATLESTGKASNGTDYDVRCNIYDMAGNCMEWTTETSDDSKYPCMGRGGSYYYSDDFTSDRIIGKTVSSYDYISFRPILYF